MTLSSSSTWSTPKRFPTTTPVSTRSWPTTCSTTCQIDKAFSEIRRVLRPGGQLFAATNGQAHMAELWEMVVQVTGPSRDANRSDLHFGLKNGSEQLAPWFAHVERRDYPNSLLVTEAEPLIAYATSSVLWGTQGDEMTTAKLAARIRQQLAEDGVIRISKNSGLFVAQR